MKPAAAKPSACIQADGGRSAFCYGDVRVESRSLKKHSAVSISWSTTLRSPSGQGLLTGWADAVADGDPLGPMYTIQAAIPAMRRRGGGAIVNIGSTSALGHGRNHSAWPGYDAGKMAQMRLTTTLGRLRAEENIRVNCLVPAWIAPPGPKEYLESLTPDQRRERGVPDTLLSLEVVADAILKLATDETCGATVPLAAVRTRRPRRR